MYRCLHIAHTTAVCSCTAKRCSALRSMFRSRPPRGKPALNCGAGVQAVQPCEKGPVLQGLHELASEAED